jgi:hypothetical protein
MKHGIWLPGDLETQDHSLPPNVYVSRLYGLDASIERNERSLCIPCALTNHDFKQRMPAPMHEAMDEEHMPKAWVDGRRYRMVYNPSPHRAMCSDCGDGVHIAYEPER